MKIIKVSSILMLAIALGAGITYLARHEIMRLQSGLPSFTHGAGSSHEVMVNMADGTGLFTRVTLPDSEPPFPTVLVRNPYARFSSVMQETLCARFVRYGYACVLQDTRGQGESEGEWSPMVNELDDGRDTLAWLVQQKFQDGHIAMVGPSYLAGVQYAAAAAGLPDEVKTLVPAVFPTDNREVLYSDGMFRHETFTAWASMMRGSNHESEDTGADYQRALRHLPHNTVDTEIFGMPMPWYQEMISSEDNFAAFTNNAANRAIYELPEKLEIPILMIGGWYDVFFGPQFKDWERLATQSESRFIIGPWTHVGSAGEAFEIENAEGGLFQWQEMLPWLEHHLKGKPLVHQPGLKLYTMGINRWSEHKAWPVEADRRTWYLADLLASNNCTGGRLTEEATRDENQVSYKYDPANPVPTRGGSGMLAFILPGFEGAKPANVLQDGLCERDDVLSFATDILETDLHIAGAIEVELDISSTAPDTAFTAKLIETFADGRMINIRDGITSLAYDRGQPVTDTYTPGEQMTTTVRLWPIDWQASKGSRLRLDISSSDFPKFHFHRNQAGPWASQADIVVATQTVHGGRLSLPIKRPKTDTRN